MSWAARVAGSGNNNNSGSGEGAAAAATTTTTDAAAASTAAPPRLPLRVCATSTATPSPPHATTQGNTAAATAATAATTEATVRLPHYNKGLLVLDANAFIKGIDTLLSVADALVTTPQVVAEVRDRAARELLERLPYTLHVCEPTSAAMRAVLSCAERTGDAGVLSRTDIRLCALALDCCKAAGCLGTPIEPRPAHIAATSTTNMRIVTEEQHDDEEAQDDEEEEDEDDGSDADEQPCADNHHHDKSADGDGEGAWITPDNVRQVREEAQQQLHYGSGNAVAERFDGGVACVTSDYAMQNTLLHLGVPVLGSGGLRIRELRLWLLRCTACFTVVVDTTRQFCPECGAGNTLRRVRYVVNDRGERVLYINFCKPLSTRGTVYNLPRPRGGKHGTNRTLVLREDQLRQVIRGTAHAKAKAQHASAHGAAGGGATTSSAFADELAGFGDVPRARRRNLAEPKATSSYHRYNVNERKKARAAHRK